MWWRGWVGDRGPERITCKYLQEKAVWNFCRNGNSRSWGKRFFPKAQSQKYLILCKIPCLPYVFGSNLAWVDTDTHCLLTESIYCGRQRRSTGISLGLEWLVSALWKVCFSKATFGGLFPQLCAYNIIHNLDSSGEAEAGAKGNSLWSAFSRLFLLSIWQLMLLLSLLLHRPTETLSDLKTQVSSGGIKKVTPLEEQSHCNVKSKT